MEEKIKDTKLENIEIQESNKFYDMNYNKRSRLRRKLERQSKIQVFYFTVGILIIIFLIINFGIGAITGIGGLFTKVNELKNPKIPQNNQTAQIIFPPILDPIAFATNSATIKITGKSIDEKGKVQLFINNSSKDEKEVEKNGFFEFEEVNLSEGENLIKVRFKKDDKTSEFSKEVKVIYKKEEPNLEITYPQEGFSFNKDDREINIQGKTDPDNTVTVNEFRAIVDTNGNFSYFLRLNEGDNFIKIEAQDQAGNKIEKEIKVTYSQ